MSGLQSKKHILNKGEESGDALYNYKNVKVNSNISYYYYYCLFIIIIFQIGFLSGIALAVLELFVDQASIELRSACLCLPRPGLNVCATIAQLFLIILSAWKE